MKFMGTWQNKDGDDVATEDYVDAVGVGVNLIDQATITRGLYLRNAGDQYADAAWFYTDYIKVYPGNELVTTGYTNLGTAPSTCYYDANKAFTRGINNNAQSLASYITVNSGEYYIRFSGMIADLSTIKLEKVTKVQPLASSKITDFAATVRVTALTGLSTATNAVIAATDTVLGALGKLQAQISGHVSGHTNIALKSSTDNRSAATTPNDYNSVLKVSGLKTNTAIGNPDASTSSVIAGIRGWTDSSGGNSHEIAFTGNGFLRHRTGATTAWGAWSKIYTEAEPPAYGEIGSAPTKLSQFENDIGAGRGTVFTASATEPAAPSPGDYWYKIL